MGRNGSNTAAIPRESRIGHSRQSGIRAEETEHETAIITPVGASQSDIYEAVLALSRSIAGRNDLQSLLSGVAESLRRIVRYDHVGLILHDPTGNGMQGHILNAPGNPVITSVRLPVDQDPAGWVWLNQQHLV